MDLDKIEAGFRQVMEGLDLNLDDPHLKDSPRRTAEAWVEELCAGLRSPEYALSVYPMEEGMQQGLIALQSIPVKSICAHHHRGYPVMLQLRKKYSRLRLHPSLAARMQLEVTPHGFR